MKNPIHKSGSYSGGLQGLGRGGSTCTPLFKIQIFVSDFPYEFQEQKTTTKSMLRFFDLDLDPPTSEFEDIRSFWRGIRIFRSQHVTPSSRSHFFKGKTYPIEIKLTHPLQYCVENTSRIFGQIFGIRDFFRWDFNGFLEDFWGDFCRIFGGVLEWFSHVSCRSLGGI